MAKASLKFRGAFLFYVLSKHLLGHEDLLLHAAHLPCFDFFT